MMKQNRNSLRKKHSLLRRAPQRRLTGLVIESLESRELLSASPWQNPVNPVDVYGTGKIGPADALAIINALNDNGGSFSLQSPGSASPQVATNTPAPVTPTNPQGLYLDVLGTGQVTPADALSVINALNVQPAATNFEVGVTLQAVATNQFTASLTGGTATANLQVGASSATLTITGDTQDEGATDLVTINQGSAQVSALVSVNGSGTGTATITNATSLTTLKTINAISGATITATNSTTDNAITGTFGGVVITTVTPGETFDLVSNVQDLRSSPSGVYAAYTNVAFSNTSLATPEIAYLPLPGSSISDGETFTVSDNSGHTSTFEFDTSGTNPQSGNISVTYTTTDTAATVASEVMAAINADSALVGVTASILPDGDVFLSSGLLTGSNSNLLENMVAYGAGYTNYKAGAVSDGSIIDAGSGSTVTSGTPTNAGGVFGLWLDPVTVSSSVVGTQTLTFTPSNSDPTGSNTAFDTLLFNDTVDPNGVVPPSEIEYTGTSVTIQGSIVTGPTVSVASASVQNSASGTVTLNFPVTIANPSASPITLDYSTANGTAVSGTDYQGVTSGSITIPANATTANIPITVLQAAAVGEPNKTFTLNLSLPSGETGDMLATSSVTGTIVNTDFPTASVSSPSSVTAGSSITYTISLSAASQQAFTATYTLSGTASPTTDFTGPTTGTVTVAAGSLSATVVVPTVNNPADTNPTLTLTLTSPNGGTLVTASSSTQIIDGSAVSASNVTQAAPPLGSSTMNFTVSLPSSYFTENPSVPSVQVNYTFVNGTAVNGTDYTGTNGSVTFTNGGSTTQTISATIASQTEYEASKTFTVDLSLASSYPGLSLATPSVTGTITPGVAQPTVSIAVDSANPSGVTASKTTAETYVFDANLSTPSSVATTVNVSVAGSGTTPAQSGKQFTPPSFTSVTIPAGQTSEPFDITIPAETEYYLNPATFTVTISSPTNATLGTSTAIGTVTDPVTAPTISVASSSFTASSSGSTTGNITVSLSQISGVPVTFNYATSNGPAPSGGVIAQSGVDYTGVASSATIPAGTQSITIPVTISGQPDYSPSRGFTFTISSPTNVAGSGDTLSATETITYPAVSAPTVSIQGVSEAVPSGGTTFNFPVKLSAPSSVATTITYQTVDGTATAASGVYTPITSGSLVIPAGSTTGTISVHVNSETLTSNESFSVDLLSATNATLGTPSTATGTLLAYTVSTCSGYVFLDPEEAVNAASGATKLATETPLQNVSILLTGTSSITGAVSIPMTTAADGSFSFSNLTPGTYVMTETVPTGFLGATSIYNGAVAGTNQINLTIPSLGGVTSTNDNFVFTGVSPTSPYASQRGYLSSDGNSSDPAPIVIGSTSSTSTQSPAVTTPTGAAGLLASSASPQVSPQVAGGSTTLGAGVVQTGSTVTFTGTGGNDSFSFTAGAEDTVTFNGAQYTFNPATVKSVVFNGTGQGSATLTDTTGTAVASVSLGSATMTGSGFSVTVNNVGAIAVNGTSQDKATLHDSALANDLLASGTLASLTNSAGLSSSVNDFANVTLDTSAGGSLTKNVKVIDFALSEI